jgi:hypothetical protein
MPSYKLCELCTFPGWLQYSPVCTSDTTGNKNLYDNTLLSKSCVCVCVCMCVSRPKIIITLQTIPDTTRLITVIGETFLV